MEAGSEVVPLLGGELAEAPPLVVSEESRGAPTDNSVPSVTAKVESYKQMIMCESSCSSP